MDIATLGLRLDANGFVRGVADSERALSGLDRTGERVISNLKRNVAGLVGLFGAGFFARKLLEETTASQDALAQLQAAVKSTGGAAGLTAGQLDEMSVALQRTTRYGDEAVKSAQAILLTFTKIKGAEFRGATQAVVDLSARMGGDLKGAALQVGKALNDPAIGLTALTRSGVSFTTGQEEVIKKLFATGRAAKAQQIILAELNKEFGGSAAAARNTLGGALDALKNDFGDLFEVTKGGSGALIGLLNRIDKGILFLKDHLNQTQAVVGAVVAAVAAGAAVYLTLSLAIKAAAIWQGILSGAQAVQAFFSLVKVIRSAADAMALLSMVSKGAVGAIAAVIALGVGYIAYRKIVADLNKESEKQNAELAKTIENAGGAADAVTDLTDAEKERIKAAHEANADMVRQAEQSVALAGLQGDAQERLRIEFDAANKAITARRDLTGGLLTETLSAIDAEKSLALQAQHTASELEKSNKKLEEQKQILDNFTENVQRSFADLFTNILNDGIHSFADLFDGIKRMFFRLIAELAAAKLMKGIGGSLAGTLAGIAGVAGTASGASAQAPLLPANWAGGGAEAGGPVPVQIAGVTATASKSLFASIAPYLGVAAAGFGVGSSIGGLTSNRGLGTLGGAASGAAMGALIGSVVPVVGTAVGAVVGGIAGAVGGFIGSSKRLAEEMKRQQEVLGKNNARLAELKMSLDGFALNGNTLSKAGPFAARLAQILAPGGSGINALGPGELTAAFQGGKTDPRLTELTRTYGMSFQQLAAIAKQTGIELFDSAGKLVPDAFRQLVEAVGLTVQSITTFGNNLDDIKRRQSAYNKLFDVASSPAQQLGDAFDILRKMDPALLQREGLANVNLDSETGRKVLLAGLQDIFKLIDSGGLTADLLGAFGDKNQLLDAILAAKDGLDAFGKTLNNVTTDFPKAMDVILYEQKYGRGVGSGVANRRFEPIPRDTNPSNPGTGGLTVGGNVVIQVLDTDGGEAILRKIESATAARASRGGATYLPNTVVDE